MSASVSSIASALPLAVSALPPIAILVLCIVAGVGTVMLLPGRRERSFRAIGGAIMLAVLLVLGAVIARQAGGESTDRAYFWLFSGIALMCGVRVITHEKPVYSALYFVLTVLASAGLFVLLWAEFMAAALVLIYAGAILVTYVFVIMLAQQAGSAGTVTEGAEYDRVSREPLLASIVGLALAGVLLLVIFERAPLPGLLVAAGGSAAGGDPVRAFARYLFSSHLVSFELAGVILTISVVGAVVIARRRVVQGTDLVEPPLEEQMPATIGPPVYQEDDPHKAPVYGTDNPVAKAYPER